MVQSELAVGHHVQRQTESPDPLGADHQAVSHPASQSPHQVQVCFERFRGQSEVHQCERGHFVCGNCRPRVEVEEGDLYQTYFGIFQVCPPAGAG